MNTETIFYQIEYIEFDAYVNKKWLSYELNARYWIDDIENRFDTMEEGAELLLTWFFEDEFRFRPELDRVRVKYKKITIEEESKYL